MVRTHHASCHGGPWARSCIAPFTLAICLAVVPIDAQDVVPPVAGVRSGNPLIVSAVRSGIQRSWAFAALAERLIVTVGHELVHALEVLRDPHVDTHTEVYHLFDRIGWRDTRPSFETAAAVAIERQIEVDLRRRAPSPPLPRRLD